MFKKKTFNEKGCTPQLQFQFFGGNILLHFFMNLLMYSSECSLNNSPTPLILPIRFPLAVAQSGSDKPSRELLRSPGGYSLSPPYPDPGSLQMAENPYPVQRGAASLDNMKSIFISKLCPLVVADQCGGICWTAYNNNKWMGRKRSSEGNALTARHKQLLLRNIDTHYGHIHSLHWQLIGFKPAEVEAHQ